MIIKKTVEQELWVALVPADIVSDIKDDYRSVELPTRQALLEELGIVKEAEMNSLREELESLKKVEISLRNTCKSRYEIIGQLQARLDNQEAIIKDLQKKLEDEKETTRHLRNRLEDAKPTNTTQQRILDQTEKYAAQRDKEREFPWVLRDGDKIIHKERNSIRTICSTYQPDSCPLWKVKNEYGELMVYLNEEDIKRDYALYNREENV
jgi:predicted RNase H-like nuclease (RuvC/YqgF family)